MLENELCNTDSIFRTFFRKSTQIIKCKVDNEPPFSLRGLRDLHYVNKGSLVFTAGKFRLLFEDVCHMTFRKHNLSF